MNETMCKVFLMLVSNPTPLLVFIPLSAKFMFVCFIPARYNSRTIFPKFIVLSKTNKGVYLLLVVQKYQNNFIMIFPD